MFEANDIPVLTYLKDQQVVPIRSIKIDGVDDNSIMDTLIELDDKELVKMFSNHVGITDKGKAYLRLNESDKLPKSESLIHIGHKIEGNVYDSDLSMDMSRDKQIINNSTAQSKPKLSLIEWIAIILGIIASVITIYLFLKP